MTTRQLTARVTRSTGKVMRASHLMVALCACIWGCAEVDAPGNVEHDEGVVAREGAVSEILYGAPDLRERIEAGEVRELLFEFDAVRHQKAELQALVSGAVEGVTALEVHEQFGVVSLKSDRAVSVARIEAMTGLKAVFEEEYFERHTASELAFISHDVAVQRGDLGQGIGVAVLDTGLDWTHTDFGACSAPGVSGCRVVHAQDFAPEDGERDAHGHGSNVAAIVAAVAPGADIIGLDVFDEDISSSTDILSALNWVLQNKTTYNIKVVNLSLGGGQFSGACQSTVFRSAMQSLKLQGIIAVASSGNDGYVGSMGAPACDPSVVSVGAVYEQAVGGVLYSSCADSTTVADQVACFSNTSSELDLLAPGVSVRGGGLTMTGTSQAAPFVSGAFAILQQAYPQSSVTEQLDRLRRAASVVDARNNEAVPRLDVSAMFDALTPCVYDVSPSPRVEVTAAGGEVSFQVTTQAHCDWSSQLSGEAWVTTISGGGSMQGNGVVVLSVDANQVEMARSAVLTVAGESVTVAQEAHVVPEPETMDVDGQLVLNWWRDGSREQVIPVMPIAHGRRGEVISQMCLDVFAQGEDISEGCVRGWEPYVLFTLLTLPDQDGTYHVRAKFRTADGIEDDSPMEEAIVLDRLAPEDGEAVLVQRDGALQVQFEEAHDEGMGVVGYRVWMRRGEGRAPSCFGLPGEELVYQGEAAGAVTLDVTDEDVFTVKVCAYDGARNVSRGAIATTQGAIALD